MPTQMADLEPTFDLPAGFHRLRFVYRHGGTGYIDHFNGVRLRDLKIERTYPFLRRTPSRDLSPIP